MKRLYIIAAVLLAFAGAANATTTYVAHLNGLNEVGPNASPGTGFGEVQLNDAETQITVWENWQGLLAPATASHIHGAAPVGVNAGVLFPLAGFPSGTAGSVGPQVFAITAAQVGYLKTGLLYFNIHTSQFPGGEIRGQIVPEPSSLLALGTAAAGLMGLVRRKRSL